MLTILNPLPEDRLYETHVCYFTRVPPGDSRSIELVEVITVGYKHPEAKEFAVIERTEYKNSLPVLRTSIKAAPLILLEAAQKLKFEIEGY